MQLSGIGDARIKTLGEFEVNIKFYEICSAITFYVVSQGAIQVGVITGNEFMETVCLTINAEHVVITQAEGDSFLMNIQVEEEFLCNVISEKNTTE